MMPNDDYIILTGRSNVPLAQNIASILKKEIFQPVSIFSDGEIRVKGMPNLRGRQVYIIQPTSFPVNDHLMELFLMIDAAKRASASEIVAVIPYFGYARQDRKELPRVPISASLVAKTIENAGASRILTLDIHSEQAEGFVKIPWDNIFASYSLIPEIKKKKLSNLVVASPDKGGMVRATAYANRLAAQSVAIIYKVRDLNVNNKSTALGMIGDVKDADVLIIDDMIDTAGTIANAADYLKKSGAKSIHVAATHGVFSEGALQKIEASAIEEVIVTDSINLTREVKKSKKISVVSIADLMAQAMKRIHTGDSLSKDLIL